MKSPREKISGVKILVFLILVGMLGVAYIWNSFVVDKRADEMIKLEKQLEQLKMEKLFLEARYEKLISVNYIVPYARQKLGLVFPKKNPKEIELKR
jgi:cell division protein FtsB